MYRHDGLDPCLFDRHRSKRGSIQHGAELPTTSYLEEVLQDLSQVQIAAMVAVAKEVGMKPGTITYLSASWPIAIGSILNVSTRTVEFHKQRIMELLDLKTNAELIRYAVKEGLV